MWKKNCDFYGSSKGTVVGQKIWKSPSKKNLIKSNKSISRKKILNIFHENYENEFREIAFLAVLNFFPVQKIEFWPFLKLQKIEFGQKIFCEIDLFDFMSFFGLYFLKFSGLLCTYLLEYPLSKSGEPPEFVQVSPLCEGRAVQTSVICCPWES